jgi:hypothetical protein
MCLDSDEASKYLMTFQNLLSRVPKWNNIIVEEERKRIVERSGCDYLEDLITCVHIIQLKVLTCIRVGNKQKKIDIAIPKLDIFIHKVYINVARKVYMNVYLLERNISPLQVQKNNRELESIVQECILTTIRESVPTEAIIRAYMDEGVEQEEEVTIEDVPDNEEDNAKNEEDNAKNEEDKQSSAEETVPEIVPTIQNIDDNEVVTKLEFNDMDTVLNEKNNVDEVSAPKTIERLEDISTSRAIARKLEEESDTDDERIQIHTDMVDLSGFDILDEPEKGMATDDVILDGIEELPPI